LHRALKRREYRQSKIERIPARELAWSELDGELLRVRTDAGRHIREGNTRRVSHAEAVEIRVEREPDGRRVQGYRADRVVTEDQRHIDTEVPAPPRPIRVDIEEHRARDRAGNRALVRHPHRRGSLFQPPVDLLR